MLRLLSKIAPIIAKEDKGVVHHMLLFVCKDSFNETHLGTTGDCFDDRNMPPSITECVGVSPMFAWAVGGVVSRLATDRYTIKFQLIICN